MGRLRPCGTFCSGDTICLLSSIADPSWHQLLSPLDSSCWFLLTSIVEPSWQQLLSPLDINCWVLLTATLSPLDNNYCALWQQLLNPLTLSWVVILWNNLQTYQPGRWFLLDPRQNQGLRDISPGHPSGTTSLMLGEITGALGQLNLNVYKPEVRKIIQSFIIKT